MRGFRGQPPAVVEGPQDDLTPVPAVLTRTMFSEPGKGSGQRIERADDGPGYKSSIYYTSTPPLQELNSDDNMIGGDPLASIEADEMLLDSSEVSAGSSDDEIRTLDETFPYRPTEVQQVFDDLE